MGQPIGCDGETGGEGQRTGHVVLYLGVRINIQGRVMLLLYDSVLDKLEWHREV
jgi:hypothetical protein